VWVKKSIPWGFLTFFPKRLGICSPNFTHLLHVPIYARLQIFIQLSATLTKLCHIKRDHPVDITKFHAQCPLSAETHAFRRLRKTLIAVGHFGSETSLSRQSPALVLTTQDKQCQDMTIWILDWIGLKTGENTPKHNKQVLAHKNTENSELNLALAVPTLVASSGSSLYLCKNCSYVCAYDWVQLCVINVMLPVKSLGPTIFIGRLLHHWTPMENSSK